MTRDARALTAAYDGWLAGQIPVVAADVARKHEELATDRLRFLRGTYYLWLVRVAEQVPWVLDTVRLPVVGDLHVENFGTWRDVHDTPRWGVNDLDELARGPWLLDLLRVAVSAQVAPHVKVADDDVCDLLLAAYADARPAAGIELAGKDAKHLRPLLPEPPDADRFYRRLLKGATAAVPAAVAKASAATAPPGWEPTWHVHAAGTGSLGHRRIVGVGKAADGTWHAREAKETGPGTAVWAATQVDGMPEPDAGLFARTTKQLGCSPDAVRVDGWQVRDLAPDLARIELSGLRRKDGGRLLGSMAAATVDVHGVDASAQEKARAEAHALDPHRFREAVGTMHQVVLADHASYVVGRA
ncbi:hypothetical protein GCM10011584_18360 [Nocardioides phosphati]|uniref:DUF2252 domain-containing protein n=1 Tax=Nocardioides phosphati TaxID=1867775 RepID=A0ABQ2N9A5_9ACTN|nr:DUF2252 family protein [Nocardioides phosphati]GGO89290.1 hypothetical protein GCM10011584_18360 [Nocardioides phosphati]